ncbi:MAG: nuclear transport factor 2 family protein [Steroidobacteraceae bacterium]
MTASFFARRRAWWVGLALTGCMSLAPLVSAADSAALQHSVAALQARAAALRDINDIKRLQRAYGYYTDLGQWDQVADLFSRNATLEIGLDGVYRGQDRVRQYLRAVGGGHVGLAPGQVNQSLQLMPVINLAPDGLSAKGTWRAVILAGQANKAAAWGEGPYENEYVKVDGVWKISALHWYQTLMTPYGEGGWSRNPDLTGGHYAPASLAPDAPPTEQYKVWPGAHVPHFHFKNQAPSLRTDGAQGSVGTIRAVQWTDAQLQRQLAALNHDVQLLEDQNAIEKLQRIYGYYLDKGLWSQAADLFADDGEVDIAGRGNYLGKAHVLAYLRAIGPEGPVAGRLYDNMQLQPIVHVGTDGTTAKARWHLFAQLAQAGQFHEWGVGVYENEYVKREGIWRIRRLNFYPTLYTPYEAGWAKSVAAYSRFEPDLKPDKAATALASLPAVAPFDYLNPATEAANRQSWTATPAVLDAVGSTPERMASSTAALTQRLGLLEDAAIIENLHAMYGYYLATLEWDSLTDLWAPEGTIEIALRGVYVGKPAVRRNLNLYGQQGLDDGVLHNHMQYQPVIDVARDGLTAKMRSRAFSMMGNYGKNGTWMGGVYENTYVKRDGIWRIESDHVINSYFAPYDVGWKDLAARDAPGITGSNPPDAPPTVHFEMYPRSFLPPFHYLNPVTGK